MDWLVIRIRGFGVPHAWLPDSMFDMNNDTRVDRDDHHVWVKDLKHTWYGDANLDGEFNSSDLVKAFVSGKYEKAWTMFGMDGGLHIRNGASWSEGDWNGDGMFDSSDMVTAFADGGYENGLETAAVPEPTAFLLLIPGLCAVAILRRRIRS